MQDPSSEQSAHLPPWPAGSHYVEITWKENTITFCVPVSVSRSFENIVFPVGGLQSPVHTVPQAPVSHHSDSLCASLDLTTGH